MSKPIPVVPGRAAIYTRISKDTEGEKVGVARQLADCIALAESSNLDVVATFSDNDIGASTRSTKARPQFEDMLDRAQRGEFTHLLAYSNSRLTRRPREVEDLIHLSERYGVRIRTVVSGDDDLSTADGRMVARIKGNVDAAEAERTGERVSAAARHRLANGGWIGGVPPFGYKREDKGLIPNPDEVALVEEATRRLLDLDESLYSIVKSWVQRGTVTRVSKTKPNGTTWRHSALRAALTNQALIGLNSAGVPAWDPIIDVDTFERLKDKLIDPRRVAMNPDGRKSAKYALGGGLVVCGWCGKPLSAIARNVGDRKEVKLVCRSFLNGSDEDNHTTGFDGRSTNRVKIDHDGLLEYAFERAFEHLNDSAYWEDQKRKRADAGSDTAKHRDTRKAKEFERERVLTQHRVGAISDVRLVADLAIVDAELAAINQKIDTSSGGPSARDVWAGRESKLKAWAKWQPGEQRLFLSMLIDKIEVGNWPRGIPTTTLPKKNETTDQFKLRRSTAARDALKKRVTIHPLDDLRSE
ncbi:recombinase family protein [Glaciihabitans sp. UYNi722]|uniref:recombinase family protein n=1 Tax=Glaciihabitans sp. UYNi722 TaxID=3156344 RepID=UPI003391FA27